MKYLVPVVVLVVATAGCAPTGPVFSVQDRAGLGAFLAFEIVANDAGSTPIPTPDGAPAGDWCDECTPGGVPLYPSHPGKVGDGTVFNTCPVCGGTQKAPGSVQEEIDQLGDAIDNVSEDWNESIVRDLGDKLADVLEAQGEEQNEPDILCMGGSAWTFEDKRIREATNADMVKHLVEVHDIEYESASKMSREELIALHNLLHNTEIRASAPSSSCPSGNCPTSRGSKSSCPSGTCPTSKGNSSSSRRGLFGWRR
tara:strand:- start:441 stop:1205 length:765 start_codon:yes stop_codon:yes gene_type:complete